MNSENNIQLIHTFAEENGIIAGVTNCRRLYAADERELINVPFVTSDISRRLKPSLSCEWVKSIIVIGVGYKKITKAANDDSFHGRMSQNAVGQDYHIVVRNKLEALANFLLTKKVFKYIIYVDTGDLLERSLAVDAGLGYIGRNRAVISEKFGSMFNIGYMITDLEIEAGLISQSKKCPDECQLCISACPGKALKADEGSLPSRFDYRQCVSYLTQKKGELTESEKRSMNDWVYGCDICQTVCPANINVEAEIIDDTGALFPGLDEIINISDDGFKKRFGSTAVFWRGKKILIRNAENAKRNKTVC